MLPVTMPDDELMLSVVAVVLHVPPPTVFVSGMVDPTHTETGPAIAAGSGLTVTTVVVKQLAEV